MAAAPLPLLRAPVLIVPRRADRVVRALVEDAASPVTAVDGTVLGAGAPGAAPARPARARPVSRRLDRRGQPAHATCTSTFAVEDADGSPVLRLSFTGSEVRVQDETETEIGVLVNEGKAGGPDVVVVRMYGPAGGEPLAQGSAPYAQAPDLTVIDAARSTVARTARVGDRVSTEILTDSLALRTILAGFACSLVMPEWIERPRMPTGGGG